MNASRHPHITRNAALLAGGIFTMLALALHACDIQPPEPHGLTTVTTPTSSAPAALR